MTSLLGRSHQAAVLRQGRVRPFLPAQQCRPLRIVHVAAKKSGEAVEPDQSFGLVAQQAEFFRALPLYAGGAGVASLLLNRALSGIAPVVDASSSQSRADVLGIVLSAVLLLTGLQWLALKPREVAAVDLEGSTVDFVEPGLKPYAALLREFAWARDAMFSTTRCKSLVLLYKGRTLFHYGFITKGVKPGNVVPGEICTQVRSSSAPGKGAHRVCVSGLPIRPQPAQASLPAAGAAPAPLFITETAILIHIKCAWTRCRRCATARATTWRTWCCTPAGPSSRLSCRRTRRCACALAAVAVGGACGGELVR